jgi:hypothetical protein
MFLHKCDEIECNVESKHVRCVQLQCGTGIIKQLPVFRPIVTSYGQEKQLLRNFHLTEIAVSFESLLG